ncbi:hypothetical protein HKX48_007216 [Thoreauomyces humboldtii]|nr:hypothetical protein HKX48_007216 [Thoreauomyces humboldtii]
MLSTAAVLANPNPLAHGPSPLKGASPPSFTHFTIHTVRTSIHERSTTLTGLVRLDLQTHLMAHSVTVYAQIGGQPAMKETVWAREGGQMMPPRAWNWEWEFVLNGVGRGDGGVLPCTVTLVAVINKATGDVQTTTVVVVGGDEDGQQEREEVMVEGSGKRKEEEVHDPTFTAAIKFTEEVKSGGNHWTGDVGH